MQGKTSEKRKRKLGGKGVEQEAEGFCQFCHAKPPPEHRVSERNKKRRCCAWTEYDQLIEVSKCLFMSGQVL